jgi:hypothetical protein
MADFLKREMGTTALGDASKWQDAPHVSSLPLTASDDL